MKTIGMLGGMSWESTSVYYRMINEATKRALGGFHSAPIAMVSVDFAEIEELQQRCDWTASADLLSVNARQIEAAGAELLLICTNTMHKVADEIAAAVKIPLLHIADATASRIIAAGYSKVGLLGTRFTMEEKFYSGRLEQLGLEVLTPNEADRILIHRVIYEELCMGEIRDDSRRDFVSIIDRLSDAGAECVVEGCTEITMLVGPDDVRVPLFDTTAIHAEEAVAMALQ
ncbi:MAG: aspartate/glutamate racemase family protein [Woeseia sp.]|jgi:aspartate racemase|nr:aspartate/glutamate racemase family protein [Woeseia sp.]MBT6209925.1 aspartate/glutamate racemase family protein [Woeseia sp.]